MDPILLHKIVENSGITWQDAEKRCTSWLIPNPPFEMVNAKYCEMIEDLIKRYSKIMEKQIK